MIEEFEGRYREQLSKTIFLSDGVSPAYLPQCSRICTREDHLAPSSKFPAISPYSRVLWASKEPPL